MCNLNQYYCYGALIAVIMAALILGYVWANKPPKLGS